MADQPGTYQCPKCYKRYSHYVSQCTGCGVRFSGVNQVSELHGSGGGGAIGCLVILLLIGLGIAAYKGAIPLPEGLRKNLPGAQQQPPDAAKGLKPRAR